MSMRSSTPRIKLIEVRNPRWVDLYPGLLAQHGGGIG
jgi:hypothetical protein